MTKHARFGALIAVILAIAYCVSVAPKSTLAAPDERAPEDPAPVEPETPDAEVVNEAIESALDWLRDHQAEDGSWDPTNYADEGEAAGRDGDYANADGSEDQLGWQDMRVGVTAWALLAYLGAGHTHLEGEYRDTVKQALRYLKAVQDSDGCFGPREDSYYMICHAVATMAFAESYAMTASVLLKGPTQKAVDFLLLAQNEDAKGRYGWRYGIKPGDNDTIVTGWCALALYSATVAALDVPDEAFAGAMRWIEDVTDPDTKITGFITRGGATARLMAARDFKTNPECEAVSVVLRKLLPDANTEPVDDQIRHITDHLPTADDALEVDYYYWYWGTLACALDGQKAWDKWWPASGATLLAIQRTDGDSPATFGSWDAVDAWSPAFGRVYATAINALTLQVSYRMIANSDDAGGDDDE